MKNPEAPGVANAHESGESKGVAAGAAGSARCRIRAQSVMGWPVWVMHVDETRHVAICDEFDGSPIIRCGNQEKHGRIYTREEAERLLPIIRPVYPSAEIVPVEPNEKGQP
jgi:hypothetical protein